MVESDSELRVLQNPNAPVTYPTDHSESVILLFGTEGATDPQLYQEITGTSYAL